MIASVSAEPDFLSAEGLSLLLFGGKGGVGKTTCASAAALYLARKHPEQTYLLVSTDPAHSLADCFAADAVPANLKLQELNPQESLARFKARHQVHLRTIALRGTFLDQADVDQLLDLSMPGLDEVMALLEIVAWIKENRFSCILVDTAPAGHTLRLLGLPTVMHQWMSALDSMLAKHRYMTRLYRGSYQKDSVDHYLESTVADLNHLWMLLRSPVRSRFVPIMLAEALSIHVTGILLQELKHLGITVQDIVVNRLIEAQADCPNCRDWESRQSQALAAIADTFAQYTLWGLPLFLDHVRGVQALQTVWEHVRRLNMRKRNQALSVTFVEQQACVTDPASLPAHSMKLILFAGKGGVGKTTLACASALRLAEQYPEKKILLFSIDPAHSLGACLERTVGPQETRIAPGLTAIELDAQAEFAYLRQRYTHELTGVLASASGQAGIDFAFDRDVMERMIDLAPPGLDEMLALMRIVKLIDQESYDLFILDTAPTGHLLRFLEMPELIESWLKTFFSLFLKYKNIFWLPNVTALMVELSRRIKSFRRILIDPERSALMAVAIPSQMAFEETKDLLAACQRLGVSVPGIFVNMITPDSDCRVCSVIRRMEQPILRQYASEFAGHQIVHVARQHAPQGFERLRTLGQALYNTPSLVSI